MCHIGDVEKYTELLDVDDNNTSVDGDSHDMISPTANTTANTTLPNLLRKLNLSVRSTPGIHSPAENIKQVHTLLSNCNIAAVFVCFKISVVCFMCL